MSSDERGSTSILFALCCIVVLLFGGLAIDGGRAFFTSQKMMAVLDAAALAAAKAMREQGLTDDQVKALAESWIRTQMHTQAGKLISVGAVDITVDRARNTVTADMTATVSNFIAPLVGLNRFAVRQLSSATYGVTSVELGLMLDVSGSMNDYGKIGDLKAAVRSMLEIMMPDNAAARGVKIGIAPYSTSVNAGSLVGKVRGGPGRCVSERRGAKAFTDDSPKGNPMGGRPTSCPVNAVQPITDQKSTLLARVDALTADGMTAGHLGAAWAWYLVSPNWGDVWPSESQPKAYGESGVLKAVVLMTDGMFNTVYEAANGNSSQQAEALCTNMKAAGVIVYTVGFQAPSSVLPVLRACSSGPAYFFDAADAAALEGAFRRIAEDLSQLRLSR